MAPDPTIIVNKVGCVASVNKLAEKAFGYDKKELLRKSLESLIPLIHKNLKSKKSGNFFNEPQPCRINAELELYGVRKNGQKFIVDISMSPLRIGEEVYTWRPSVRSQKEKVGRGVQNNAGLHRSLIEASLDPLIAISPEGKVTDVNEASVRLTEYQG